MADLTNVFLFIAGLAVSFLGAVSKYLFDKVQSHESRIQSILGGSRTERPAQSLTLLEL